MTTGPIPTPCPHCPDGHRDPRTVTWGVRVAPELDSDGQPTRLIVERTRGSHVAQSDADWLWHLIRFFGGASEYPVGPA